jgi:CubicO group peptidase (beta-lactamase class C family)
VHFQLVQETVPWGVNFDFLGAVRATHTPVSSGETVAAERAFRRDQAMRLSTRDLVELEEMAGAEALQHFNRGLTGSQISQAGIVVDGVLYLQPAETRHGIYPFADEMRHGAFSVSKTAGATVAMLRLAQKYGEAVFDQRITDHVDNTADHDGWDQVTFGDALSMTTGIGDAFPQADANVTFADEGDIGNPNWNRFNQAPTVGRRLSAAFSFGSYPWGPGEVVRYNSSHTFVLAVAMEHYLREQEGPEADLLQMLNDEVYHPIGIRWLPSMRVINDDLTTGPPPLGWGLIPNPHDVARVSLLLQNLGEFDGRQLLHRELTARALRRDGDPALPTSQGTQLGRGQFVDIRYRDSTWSVPVSASGECPGAASWMEGLGGNYVTLMPSGVVLFRFADANRYDGGSLVATGERIRSSCPVDD